MLISLALSLILILGCGVPLHPEMTKTSPAVHYPLLPPVSYGSSRSLEQLIEGRMEGRRVQLRIHIEIDAEKIFVVGFTPWLSRVFTLSYDGQELDFVNPSGYALPFPPSALLADIQQVLWPYLPSQGRWSSSDIPHRQERRVFLGRQLVTYIKYHGISPTVGDVELSNTLFSYYLRIRTPQADNQP